MTGRYEDHSLEIARPPRVAPCVQRYAPMPRICKCCSKGFLSYIARFAHPGKPSHNSNGKVVAKVYLGPLHTNVLAYCGEIRPILIHKVMTCQPECRNLRP